MTRSGEDAARNPIEARGLAEPASAPRVAGAVLALLVALSLAGDVYRIPIQVSDSFDLIQHVDPLPSAGAAFVDGLHASSRKFRPLRHLQTKLLLDLADSLGGRYHLVFRGYHVLLAALLVALFWHLAAVRTWMDVGALAAGLTVLTGMHTFPGMFREAYPINHFLFVAVCGLGLLALARARGGWAVDVSAALICAAGVLLLESGALLGVVAVAAYAGGLRGVSRRGLVMIAVVGVAYVALRAGLHISPAGLRESGTGYLTRWLSGDEQIRAFGQPPVALYAYTSAMSLLSVLLSQPRAGQWTVAVAYLNGHVPMAFGLEMVTSLMATVLLGWYLLSRRDDGRRRWRDPVPLVFLAVLLANAALSFSYAKDEVVSFAGTFYALAVVSAVSYCLRRASSAGPVAATLLCLTLALWSGAWTVRAAGLHLRLRHAAVDARNEWVSALEERNGGGPDERGRQLGARLRDAALRQRTIMPGMLPRWTAEWWGED